MQLFSNFLAYLNWCLGSPLEIQSLLATLKHKAKALPVPKGDVYGRVQMGDLDTYRDVVVCPWIVLLNCQTAPVDKRVLGDSGGGGQKE